MQNLAKLLMTACVLFLYGCQHIEKKPDPSEYLKEHWLSPEEYVTGKFGEHDIVFIGEYHRIKHDVDLILKLIPILHEKGIHTLGIEFGDYEQQPLVDSLLALPVFDRELAKKIMFNYSPFWGYEEYINIYKVAWEVNHSVEQNNPEKFRVINLGAHYDPCKPGGAWRDVDPDAFLADVIFKEIVGKNLKALIYSGSHHAFTRYHQPLYDFEHDTLVGFTKKRMGNIIYDSLKDRTFNIYLHAAWISADGWDAPGVLPVNGAIDSIMNLFGDRPVGFDVVNSPFAKLTCTNSYYAFGYPGFTLDQFCDGYIFQSGFKDYQPITMEHGYITPQNISKAKKNLSCIGLSQENIDSLTVENANEVLFEDIRNHFSHLIKKVN